MSGVYSSHISESFRAKQHSSDNINLLDDSDSDNGSFELDFDALEDEAGGSAV
jgi:hypothetical protein